jgi:hypothetical protein
MNDVTSMTWLFICNTVTLNEENGAVTCVCVTEHVAMQQEVLQRFSGASRRFLALRKAAV